MSVTSAQEILAELTKLEQLAQGSASSSTLPVKAGKTTKSSAPPLLDTLTAFEEAFDELQRQVVEDSTTIPSLSKTLSAEVDRRRGEVDKGLKEWYSGLSKVGKAIDKVISYNPCFLSNATRLTYCLDNLFCSRILIPKYWRSQRLMRTLNLSSATMKPRWRWMK